MRSNDVIFGYKNDYAWQYYVLEKLRADLNYRNMIFYKADGPHDIEQGNIYWQVMNLHVYDRHFHLVK
jgi:thymidylate synthase